MNTIEGHRWGGIIGNDEKFGRVAVETIALCLESGKLGLFDPPIIRSVPGEWQFGQTVRSERYPQGRRVIDN